jgi:hypothetical protein
MEMKCATQRLLPVVSGVRKERKHHESGCLGGDRKLDIESVEDARLEEPTESGSTLLSSLSDLSLLKIS